MTETSPTKFNWVNCVFTTNVPPFTPGECDEGTLEWVSLNRLDSIPTPKTDYFIYEHLKGNHFFVFDAIYNEKSELIKLVDEISNMILFEQ